MERLIIKSPVAISFAISCLICNLGFAVDQDLEIPFLGNGVTLNCESRWTKDGRGVDLYITGASDERKIHVDYYKPEGGAAPEIKSIFVNGVKSKKLFVIVAWNGDEPALRSGGNIYQVFAYDELIDQNGSMPKLRRDAELTWRFGIGFDGVREGTRLTYKYKTAASVRRQLREWGYQ